jgi:type III secretory pathway component EscV
MATLTIRIAHGAKLAPLLRQSKLEEIQRDLFQSRGVLCPLPVCQEEAGFKEDGWEVLLNEQQIVPVTESPIWPLLFEKLEEHAAEFVGPVAVEFHLQQLAGNVPDLIAAVRAAFTIEQLMSLLRAKVQAGSSIRDLAAVLEDLLQSSVLAPPPSHTDTPAQGT